MNKRFSKFMLTSASALALLAAYPSVASTAEVVGFDLPAITAEAATQGNAFIRVVRALPSVANITSADASSVRAARNLYNSLPNAEKADADVTRWAGYLADKEAALPVDHVRNFLLESRVLPNVAEINAMNATEFAQAKVDLQAARASYAQLTDAEKANADVARWAGYLTVKEDAFGVTFILAAKDLPSMDAIGEMDAEELVAVQEDIDSVRELYDALSDVAKADTEVARWIGYVDQKEEAVEAASVVEIESVRAVGSKALEVKFNTEADLNASDFSVAKGQINSNISSVKIADDKKSARIELAAKLTEGTYTVTVKAEETLTASVTAENEKLGTIEILSNTTPILGASTDKTAKVGIEVLNQYGEDYSNFVNLTATPAGATTVKAAVDKNVVTVNLLDAAKKGDSFVLTVIDGATGAVDTETILLTEEAIASTVEVGSLYNKDGKTIDQDTDTETNKFYLPVVIKDQYGQEVKDAKASDLVIVSANPSVAQVANQFETITIDGKSTQALAVTLGDNPLAGTTPVTLVVKTSGHTAQTSVTVAPGKSIANISLGAPINAVVAQGEEIKFPLSVIDNEGNAITSLKELKALADGRGFNSATEQKISEEDGVLLYSETASNPHSLTVVVQTENGRVATRTVTVRDTAKVALISAVNTNKKLDTNFRSDAAAAKTFALENFVFHDQYGRAIPSDKLPGTLSVVASVADEDKSPFTIGDYNIAVKPDLDGITATSDTVTFVAYLGDEEVKGSNLDVVYTIADVSSFVPGSFTVNPVDTVYVNKEGYTVPGDAADSDYTTDTLVVKGKAKSGEIVTLKEGEYTFSARPELDVDFFKDAAGKSVTQKTVNRRVTINQTGEEILVPVTYSTATPATQKVEAYVDGKVVSSVKAQAGAFDLAGLLETADFVATNQYGVETEFTSAQASRVTFSIVSGEATFSTNGTKDAEVTKAKADSVVKAVVTTTNGKTFELNVNFVDAF